MTIQDIVELSLKIINNAYKLQSLTDRFYVLLIAFRKFVQCSLNQILDGNKSSIYILYNQLWFTALWGDNEHDFIPSQYKEELSITLIEATL